MKSFGIFGKLWKGTSCKLSPARGKLFDYTTFTSAIVEPILKVATDKQIEAKVKVQQNTAMKKEIEVVFTGGYQFINPPT